MQRLVKLHRLAMPPHHGVLGQHAAPPGGDASLFMPVKDAGLPFVPFHAGFGGFPFPLAWPALADLPAVEHQHRPSRQRELRLAFRRRGLQGCPGAGFGPASERLGQRAQGGVVHRHGPLTRHGGGLGIRGRGSEGERQLVR